MINALGTIGKTINDLFANIRRIGLLYVAGILFILTRLIAPTCRSTNNARNDPMGTGTQHQTETTSMRALNLRHLLLLAQSFAFFVALSTFMGRIYYLTYYENLNIPTSENYLNPLDYALVSPDVTILGIGITLLWVVIWLVRVPRAKTWHWATILIGLVMVGAGFFSEFSPLGEQSQPMWPGLLGVREFFRTGLILLGSYIVSSGFVWRDESSSVDDNPAKTRTLRIFLLVFFFILLSMGVLVLTASAVEIAETNARFTLEYAPQVEIEFHRSIVGTLLDDVSGMCNVEAKSCSFELILLGNQSIYVQPITSAGANGQTIHFSFPIEDIARIAYTSVTPDK